MFYSITGTVVAAQTDFLAVSCSGVAFKINTSAHTIRRVGGIGSQATLLTYTSVREDAIELFGFDTKEELDCFKMLIDVSGVGPKAALSILSEFAPQKLAYAIASADVASIKRAQGVGPKIAQRIVLELKDKMIKNFSSGAFADGAAQDMGVPSASASTQEALAALEVLGYSRMEASRALAKADEQLSTQDKIKFALKQLGG